MTVHRNFAIRFYPSHGSWTCVVQRLGADGMPLEPDVVTAAGATKEQALHAARLAATEPDVQKVLEEYELTQ
jgi:hypothetical protein